MSATAAPRNLMLSQRPSCKQRKHKLCRKFGVRAPPVTYDVHYQSALPDMQISYPNTED